MFQLKFHQFYIPWFVVQVLISQICIYIIKSFMVISEEN